MLAKAQFYLKNLGKSLIIFTNISNFNYFYYLSSYKIFLKSSEITNSSG